MSKKYIIVNDGIDFRRIAKIMTEAGMNMNHATARNQLMSAMENLLFLIGHQVGIKLTKKHMESLLSSQDIHNSLSDVLHRAYNKNPRK